MNRNKSLSFRLLVFPDLRLFQFTNADVSRRKQYLSQRDKFVVAVHFRCGGSFSLWRFIFIVANLNTVFIWVQLNCHKNNLIAQKIVSNLSTAYTMQINEKLLHYCRGTSPRSMTSESVWVLSARIISQLWARLSALLLCWWLPERFFCTQHLIVCCVYRMQSFKKTTLDAVQDNEELSIVNAHRYYTVWSLFM